MTSSTRPSPGLTGITAFFNPTRSPLLLQNLIRFSRAVRAQGLPLTIVELAFGDLPYEVDDSLGDRVIRRRSSTRLWQKERLINLALHELPAHCTSVAWLDGDVLFENDDWIAQAEERLRHCAAVQLFETACWLPRDATTMTGDARTTTGLAARLAQHPDRGRALAEYFNGHTGFAWAARRDLLERHGLYDRAIAGGGDMINAHVFAGDQEFLRGANLYTRMLTAPERQAIEAWGTPLHGDARGALSFVPGRLLHLWHGDIDRRRYHARLRILAEHDYDPARDVALDDGGCWTWNSDKPALHDAIAAYFDARNAS
jgi:hypothetical protein